MTNASILSILAHATPTPTSRSKGQKSKSRGGGILWRPPSRTACFLCYHVMVNKVVYNGIKKALNDQIYFHVCWQKEAIALVLYGGRYAVLP